MARYQKIWCHNFIADPADHSSLARNFEGDVASQVVEEPQRAPCCILQQLSLERRDKVCRYISSCSVLGPGEAMNADH